MAADHLQRAYPGYVETEYGAELASIAQRHRHSNSATVRPTATVTALISVEEVATAGVLCIPLPAINVPMLKSRVGQNP